MNGVTTENFVDASVAVPQAVPNAGPVITAIRVDDEGRYPTFYVIVFHETATFADRPYSTHKVQLIPDTYRWEAFVGEYDLTWPNAQESVMRRAGWL